METKSKTEKSEKTDWAQLSEHRVHLLLDIIRDLGEDGTDLELHIKPGAVLQIGAGECAGILRLMKLKIIGNEYVAARAIQEFETRKKLQSFPRS